jgi:hypothetical protein
MYRLSHWWLGTGLGLLIEFIGHLLLLTTALSKSFQSDTSCVCCLEWPPVIFPCSAAPLWQIRLLVSLVLFIYVWHRLTRNWCLHSASLTPVLHVPCPERRYFLCLMPVLVNVMQFLMFVCCNRLCMISLCGYFFFRFQILRILR